MRIADMCTRLDDALSVAALYQCIPSMLYRLRAANQRLGIYPQSLVQESRWRAQRYDTQGGLVDFGVGEVVPFSELLEKLLVMVAEDAELPDCMAEIENAREIVCRGTSAYWQLALYNGAMADGAFKEEALASMVDALIEKTVSYL